MIESFYAVLCITLMYRVYTFNIWTEIKSDISIFKFIS